ncbi:aldehyde dehydrogenase family protein [Georgenia sp. Z1491]|uniref:aldehyde dehydrogenase family protein n=1 Tax=Georgenia sp. Z1491 TaxID=3416707 RepID=UPI003CEC6C48
MADQHPPVPSDEAHVPGVVARLRRTFEAGATLPRESRRAHLADLRRLLTEGGDELGDALAADLGRHPTESWLVEIAFTVGELDHVARNLRRWTSNRRVPVPATLLPASATVVREPLGVVGVIAPWNYPVQLVLAPLVGALAAGNTVVLKPSEVAPATSRALAGLAARHLDPDVVGIVQGGAGTTTALLEERLDHIFYTGGSRVARIVATAAAQNLTPVTLELGGCSPVWVDPRQDLKAVAGRIAWAKWLNAGQTCVAPNHVLTTPDAAGPLADHLADAVRAMYGADPSASPDYGCLVSEQHHARVAALLDDSVAAGAHLHHGGRRDTAARYLEPTILTGVRPHHRVMSEEIFGPVLPIVEVDSLGSAIDQIRAGEHPLAAYAFTDDDADRRRLVREVRAGGMAFGAPMLQLSTPGLPFGGVGESGTGAYHGEASVRLFSHEKSVFSKPLRPDTLALVRAPYGRRTRGMVRAMFGIGPRR